MGYYVLADDGNRYGPADEATLNQWIAEGRLFPHSMLQSETTGDRMPASNVMGLNFSATAPSYSAPPSGGYASPSYARPADFAVDDGSKDMKLAWAMGAISPVLSLFCIFGLVTAITGIRAAWSAKDKGHKLWAYAFGLNIFALVLWVVTRFMLDAFSFR